MNGLGGIILLGGKSERMGTDKYLLPFFNLTLIEYLCDELSKVTDEIICVTNEPEKLYFLFHHKVSDIQPVPSALTGIHAGLVHSKYHYNFILACDLPLFHAEVVRIMIKHVRDDTQIVVPHSEKGYESLCGIYSKKCIPLIENLISSNDLRISDLYTQTPTVLIESSEIESTTHSDVFFNMNTREDYVLALEKFQKRWV
ncbi:molybdenum cofactor guanylyltransferase [bacterium]|nr:molybdenum cofactor guanylyltransferase [bacterium]